MFDVFDKLKLVKYIFSQFFPVSKKELSCSENAMPFSTESESFWLSDNDSRENECWTIPLVIFIEIILFSFQIFA